MDDFSSTDFGIILAIVKSIRVASDRVVFFLSITVSSGGQFTVESADGKKENHSIRGYSYTLDDGKYNAKIGGGKIIQITTGADGKVSSVALSQ